MNKAELKKRLETEGFRPDGYNLEGSEPPYDGYILRVHGLWYVEYAERGIHRILGQFVDEEAACDFLYKVLCKDSTSRQWP